MFSDAIKRTRGFINSLNGQLRILLRRMVRAKNIKSCIILSAQRYKQETEEVIEPKDLLGQLHSVKIRKGKNFVPLFTPGRQVIIL